MARKARTWKGARTPSALKRVRRSIRRREMNRRPRSEAKTLVQRATSIAVGHTAGDSAGAVTAAISALDRAAAKGIIHPNNAARRKSRLLAKVNAVQLAGDQGTAAAKTGTASRTAQRKKVAAAKASKAASARSPDVPRTAAGKARVAVSRATRGRRGRATETGEPESS